MFRKIQTIGDSLEVTSEDLMEFRNSVSKIVFPETLFWRMSEDTKKFFKKEKHHFQHKDKKKRGGKYRRLIS